MLGAGPGLAPAAAGGLAAAQGRCAACGAAIGWRYPAIELLTAVLFAACAWRFGPTPIALCGMGLSASLVALAWIDLESTLLPDAITLPLAWAGLLVNLGDGFTPLPLAVLGAVAGYGFLWLIFHAFRYFTGREGMGYGDFKLLAALGAWFVGALPMLLLAASLAGVLVGGTMTLAGRARRGQPLPFGPYLALAGVAVLLLGGEPAGKAVAMISGHGAGARAVIHGAKAMSIFKIGLTGGIGSGKSRVADMLAEWGASVVDTDEIARALTAAGGSAMPAIEQAFGAEALAEDGSLDRAWMRERAFADVSVRQRLEAVLHPLIGDETERQADAARGCYLVFVVPLLVESLPRWRRAWTASAWSIAIPPRRSPACSRAAG